MATRRIKSDRKKKRQEKRRTGRGSKSHAIRDLDCEDKVTGGARTLSSSNSRDGVVLELSVQTASSVETASSDSTPDFERDILAP